MRYYKLTIGPVPSTTLKTMPASLKKAVADDKANNSLVYTSYYTLDPQGGGYIPSGNPWGMFDGGALDLEFKVDQITISKSTQASIKIYGLDREILNQASNMEGREIELQAGLGKGFPICNPAQAGLILRGRVNSGIGVDPDCALQLYIKPYIEEHDKEDIIDKYVKRPKIGEGPKKPAKGVYLLHMYKGDNIALALSNCIKQHFKDYEIRFLSEFKDKINSNKDFQYPYNDFETLCYDMCADGKENSIWYQYTGYYLYIFAHDKTIYLTDGTKKQAAKAIRFEELIGQPSWDTANNGITFQCLMRSDIIVGDHITLPTFDSLNKPNTSHGVMTNTPSTKQQSRFAGTFFITQISYLGKFRSKIGNEWVATYTAKPFVPPKKNDTKNADAKKKT